ncbi:hypothetical protein [Mycobacterium sp. 1423905.2]|uniref:hypothetical protein n=1 Tax=Mycobacterium sp. 1423905.2 TaxID=1856859 RepID=UPI0020A568AD|nr:hypothetical protein [Mycobacterium sp. 1423905.2]
MASVPALAADECQPAELFATDDTAALPAADPPADDLTVFEWEADATLTRTGAAVSGSTLVDGVFWSDQSHQISTERSREFHLCVDDKSTLHTAAAAVRDQFHQQAVLTFVYLSPQAPEADAAILTVPDVDLARFRAAFAADATAQHRLLGGSVTTGDHTLILVAADDDLDLARRLIAAAGGNSPAIAYGKREFV